MRTIRNIAAQQAEVGAMAPMLRTYTRGHAPSAPYRPGARRRDPGDRRAAAARRQRQCPQRDLVRRRCRDHADRRRPHRGDRGARRCRRRHRSAWRRDPGGARARRRDALGREAPRHGHRLLHGVARTVGRTHVPDRVQGRNGTSPPRPSRRWNRSPGIWCAYPGTACSSPPGPRCWSSSRLCPRAWTWCSTRALLSPPSPERSRTECCPPRCGPPTPTRRRRSPSSTPSRTPPSRSGAGWPPARQWWCGDGERGCMVFHHGRGTQIPAFPQKAVDTNGAGDTHTGVLLAERALGTDWESAATRANAAAAIAVTRHGTESAPTRAEVDAFLA